MLRSREVSMRGSISVDAARDALGWLYSMRSRREALRPFTYEMRLGRFADVPDVPGGTDLDLRLTSWAKSERPLGAGAVLRARLRPEGTGCRLDGRVRPNRLFQGLLLGIGAGCAAGALALGSLLLATPSPSTPADITSVVALSVGMFVLLGALATSFGWRMADRVMGELVHECATIVEDRGGADAAAVIDRRGHASK